jgi:chorismate mutase/prephenate dehydrogenase
MMKRFAYRFLALLEDVQSNDKAAFTKIFSQVSDYFGDYADIFMQESKVMLAKADQLKKY